MKPKIMSFAVTTLIICCFITSSLGGGYDFRKTRWGMTVAEVKASEKSAHKFRSYNSGIYYETEVLGKSLELSYYFKRNKLVSAEYRTLFRDFRKKKYVTDTYHVFKNVLTKKYGNSVAVAPDQEQWKTDKTIIRCLFGSSKSNYMFLLRYFQKEYFYEFLQEESKKKEEQILKKKKEQEE